MSSWPGPVPQKLIDAQRHSEDGQAWLTTLPTLVRTAAERWQLDLGAPLDSHATCSWVAPCHRDDGESLVLKIGLPHMEALHEAEGLMLWNQATPDSATVRLVDHDKAINALLLERCVPGTPLTTLPEADQDTVVCEALRRLWQAPARTNPAGSDDDASDIRSLADMIQHWGDGVLAQQDGFLRNPLVFQGLDLFQQMLGSTREQRLLATDLHAGNVLAATREPWLVIDPKPFVGDPAYDLTQHALNCKSRLMDSPVALVERLAALSATDVTRIAGWLAARLMTNSLQHPEFLPSARRLLSVSGAHGAHG